MTNEQKRSRRDRLTLTTNEGKSELTEQDLSRVAGGSIPGATSEQSTANSNSVPYEFLQALGLRA
jgi:hypothetical protein